MVQGGVGYNLELVKVLEVIVRGQQVPVEEVQQVIVGGQQVPVEEV